MRKLRSMKRFTQLARQPSSFLSSLLPLMPPGTHFVQQIWVSWWVSVSMRMHGQLTCLL